MKASFCSMVHLLEGVGWVWVVLRYAQMMVVDARNMTREG